MLRTQVSLITALLATLLTSCASQLTAPDYTPVTPDTSVVAQTEAITLSIEPSDLHIRMKPLDGEAVFRKEPYDRSSFPVLTALDGRYVEGKVAVSGSFTRIFRKKSLRISLNEGRWHGNRRIALDAMGTDPSYLREWAAWDLAHSLGMTGPIARMVRLHLNDKYIGPFMAFDWIDPAMLERRGLGGDGILHHPIDSAYCGDFRSPNIAELKRCWFDLSREPGDFSELSLLSAELAETPTENFHELLERRFDVDSVINWIVMNSITSSTDTYNKNYFLYYSRKTEKWIVIPWDYDLAFGRNADPALPYPQTILNDNFQYFYTPEAGNPSPLKEKLLSNPILYERLKQRIAHVLGEKRDPTAPEAAFGWLEPERFRARLSSWASVMLPEVQHDQYSMWDVNDFYEHIEGLDYYGLARYTFLRHQVLGTTVFNTPQWLPYRSYPFVDGRDPFMALERFWTPVDISGNASFSTPGSRVVVLDEQFSRPIGVVLPEAATQPLTVRIEAETGRAPQHVPPLRTVEQCIERTWFIDLKTPQATARPRILVEYLEENSLRHEVGAAIKDQRRISLWAYNNSGWSRLKTRSNSVSKTLSTDELTLRSGEVTRLVACADPVSDGR